VEKTYSWADITAAAFELAASTTAAAATTTAAAPETSQGWH
jgi:hypothetical protein